MYSRSKKSDHVCSGTLQTGNFPAPDTVHQKSSDPLEPGKSAVRGNELEWHTAKKLIIFTFPDWEALENIVSVGLKPWHYSI